MSAPSDRPNPLGAAATRVAALVAPLGGVLSALAAYGALTTAQAGAVESILDVASPTVTAAGVIVAGLAPPVAVLAAAFGVAKSARRDVTPTSDPRGLDQRGRLVALTPVSRDADIIAGQNPVTDPEAHP